MNDFYVTGAEREEPDTKSELIQAGEARFLCPDISHICISPPLPSPLPEIILSMAEG